jgi:hypothetical protein
MLACCPSAPYDRARMEDELDMNMDILLTIPHFIPSLFFHSDIELTSDRNSLCESRRT